MAFVFDFELNRHYGARVTVDGKPIAWSCVLGEVDFHISELKADLDRVGKQMNKALKKDLAERVTKHNA